MVKNSLKFSISNHGMTRLLLDALILIGGNIKRLSISHRGKLICIHEKSHFYKNCNTARDVDNENRKSGSKNEGFTGVEAKGVD
jgi:hypothetical protein